MNQILLAVWVAVLLSGCAVVLWSENVEIDGIENHTATGKIGKTKPTFNGDQR